MDNDTGARKRVPFFRVIGCSLKSLSCQKIRATPKFKISYNNTGALSYRIYIYIHIDTMSIASLTLSSLTLLALCSTL